MDFGGIGSAARSLWDSGGATIVPFLAAALWELRWPRRNLAEANAARWLTNLTLFACFFGNWIWLSPLVAAAIAKIGGIGATQHGLGPRSVAILLVLDGVYYFIHRLQHGLGWLWRLHAIHHSDLELDASTSLRTHPLDSLFATIMFGGAGSLVGATLTEMTFYISIVYFVSAVTHANVAIPPRIEAALGRFVVTPSFHCFHHSRDDDQHDANYGVVLVIWDHLFGTVARPSIGVAAPTAYGVSAFLSPPTQTVGALLTAPFRRLAAVPTRDDPLAPPAGAKRGAPTLAWRRRA